MFIGPTFAVQNEPLQPGAPSIAENRIKKIVLPILLGVLASYLTYLVFGSIQACALFTAVVFTTALYNHASTQVPKESGEPLICKMITGLLAFMQIKSILKSIANIFNNSSEGYVPVRRYPTCPGRKMGLNRPLPKDHPSIHEEKNRPQTPWLEQSRINSTVIGARGSLDVKSRKPDNKDRDGYQPTFRSTPPRETSTSTRGRSLRGNSRSTQSHVSPRGTSRSGTSALISKRGRNYD